MRTLRVAWALTVASLVPQLALACPYCAAQGGGGVGRSVALGALLLLPFAVAGIVYKIIRSEPRTALDRREAE